MKFGTIIIILLAVFIFMGILISGGIIGNVDTQVSSNNNTSNITAPSIDMAKIIEMVDEELEEETTQSPYSKYLEMREYYKNNPIEVDEDVTTNIEEKINPTTIKNNIEFELTEWSLVHISTWEVKISIKVTNHSDFPITVCSGDFYLWTVDGYNRCDYGLFGDSATLNPETSDTISMTYKVADITNMKIEYDNLNKLFGGNGVMLFEIN